MCESDENKEPRIRKTTVEECLTIDVFSLNRKGMLDGREYKGTMSWEYKFSGRIESVNIALIPRSEHENSDVTLIIDYYADGNGMESQHVKMRIPLVSADCFFGGYRYWFQCPYCGRRVAKLYKPRNQSRFACRHCHDLSYRSRQQYDKRIAKLIREPWLISGYIDSPNPVKQMLAMRAVLVSAVLLNKGRVANPYD